MIVDPSIYGKYKGAITPASDALAAFNLALTAKETADKNLALNIKAIEDTWAEIAA